MHHDDYDWSTFSLTFYYNAHITRVFRTWTTSEGLESFLVERAIFYNHRNEPKESNEPGTAGDTFSWDYRHDADTSGTVVDVIDKQQLTLRFSDIRLDVFFRVLDNQTEVQLIQSQIPQTPEGQIQTHLNDRSNWTFFMTNLKSILEHAKDLRDSNPSLAGSMQVGFIPMTQRDK